MAKSRDGIVFMTRAEARDALRAYWLQTRTREELLEMSEPTWERRRNYEFEDDLREAFGTDHVIAEWCPFNGRFCALRDYVEAPHPPMVDEPERPGVGVPWRTFDGSLTASFEPSCYAPRH
jgi:hypothetical protein